MRPTVDTCAHRLPIPATYSVASSTESPKDHMPPVWRTPVAIQTKELLSAHEAADRPDFGIRSCSRARVWTTATRGN